MGGVYAVRKRGEGKRECGMGWGLEGIWGEKGGKGRREGWDEMEMWMERGFEREWRKSVSRGGMGRGWGGDAGVAWFLPFSISFLSSPDNRRLYTPPSTRRLPYSITVKKSGYSIANHQEIVTRSLVGSLNRCMGDFVNPLRGADGIRGLEHDL